ncbi:U3 small nucleolar RNA-associated protein 25 [Trichodelitschia bisporula]|uniref:U3 small nucleolar RNA-associated protein 25 n=1 Tax=Trichodelitschia bisporula TaxID=703511 RepID=A0A6G1HT61_9PEZI|nr:U3 small nucleolar RNA-associated protein 25 [Trichodelitschia bisporula]
MPRKRGFISSRIQDSDDEQQQLEPQVLENDPEEADSDLSGSEVEPVTATKAYSLLLESFGKASDSSEPQKKRRKIDADSHCTDHRSSGPGDDEGDDEGGSQTPSSDDGPNASSDAESDDEDADAMDVDDDISDPFHTHFDSPDEKDLAQTLKAVSENRWQAEQKTTASLGKWILFTPETDDPSASSKLKYSASSIEALKLKSKLRGPAARAIPDIEGVERPFTSQLFEYHDILFGGRTVQNGPKLRTLACLHALNHVLKTRDRVLKNNERMKKSTDEDAEFRDQGFTRPKVLILLPTRNSCARIMKTIVELCAPEQEENRKRFEEGYIQEETQLDEERPADYRELFDGNDDDMFRIGVKFTRKTVKYFAQFYNSDIILASPLGLRSALDSEDKKKQDYDYLSSIEIVIMDQADALLMQNWEHVEYVLDHLNLQPKEAHGCDFGRVRNWYLDGNAKYLRQTIVLSAFLTPELNKIFTRYMHNVAGKVKSHPEYPGAMLDIGLHIKQTFSRFDAPSIVNDPDARFKAFTTTIIPSLTRYPKPPDGCLGVVIFIPSYFDFVRVRNYFATSSATQNISFGVISENQEPASAQVRRARSHFLSGKHSVLLYSGRAHHFFRYQIRGVKRVIMYALPDNPMFYKELVGGFILRSILDGKTSAEEANVKALFSKWDALKLERIVGTKRVGTMLKNKGGDTFDFV